MIPAGTPNELDVQNEWEENTTQHTMDQPGNVANPARGELNRENEYLPVHVRA